MANTIDFILTNAASELISKVLSGKILNFTRMAVGDGFSYDTTVAKGYKTLVNEVLSIDITKKETLSPSSVKITSAFKNTDTEKEFYYREVGLYAQDPDTGVEILYAYGNRNDAAELITPSGLNVVTKQLVFIISVGDSANVTFNVNADIYALQEDLLNAQSEIKQIQTNLSKAQENITTLQTNLGNANTNITTLQSSKANNNLVNTGMITNCILEIPQKIKAEIVDGYFILKSGSVVTVPNGEGVFDEVIISTDRSAWFGGDGSIFIFATLDGKCNCRKINECSSGTSDPGTAASAYFNTSANILNYYYAAGTSVQASFPIAICTVTNDKITSIDQLFNGIGYIGSTMWVDKGIKGLIPNGRNNDGTLNVKLLETSKIYLLTINSNGTFYLRLSSTTLGARELYISNNTPVVNSYVVWYNPATNYMYTNSGDFTNWIQESSFLLGYFESSSLKINHLSVKKTFNAVDYYDYTKKINELESRISILEAN